MVKSFPVMHSSGNPYAQKPVTRYRTQPEQSKIEELFNIVEELRLLKDNADAQTALMTRIAVALETIAAKP